MKRYVSHKEVEAAKIDHLLIGEGDSIDQVTVVTEEDDKVEVGREWFLKHSDNETKVLKGGYLVIYADGYKSWSPAEVFEAGYKEITNEGYEALAITDRPTTFGFEGALHMVKLGKKVARKGWNNDTIKVFGQFPDANSANTEPYLVMEKGNGETYKRFPLDLSAESIFADDWYVVE